MERMARKWWTLLTVCLGMLMLLLDITIVNVALPSIANDLGASFSDLQWTIDAYALSLAAVMLVMARSATCSAIAGCSRPGCSCSRSPLSAAASRPTRSSSTSAARCRASVGPRCSPPRSR
jgi:MFS family permease